MKKITKALIIVSIICIGIFAGCTENGEKQTDLGDFRTIIDMRGEEIKVPKNITRVIDISDGFVTSVLYNLGLEDTVVGIGSTNLQEIDTYEYQTAEGETYIYEEGMNPVTYLMPSIKNVPAVAEYGVAVNFETIASLEPDVVFVRVGFCSMNTDEYGEDEDITNSIDTIEALDIPTVVLYGPPACDEPTIDKISDEIITIGKVFDMEEEATELADYLEGIVDLIVNRTKDVSDEEKPEVLLFGLSPNARETGGAGDVLCTDTIESYFIEEIVNAKNAYQDTGGWKIMSTEQIIALNPDVIVLPTDWGYHPPKELYTAEYYENLQVLDAVANRRVWALPWTPYNCAKRLEYPLEIMIIAKAAYPELFSDFNISEWTLEFFKEVYKVDNETAKELRTVVWLDWTVDEGV